MKSLQNDVAYLHYRTPEVIEMQYNMRVYGALWGGGGTGKGTVHSLYVAGHVYLLLFNERYCQRLK